MLQCWCILCAILTRFSNKLHTLTMENCKANLSPTRADNVPDYLNRFVDDCIREAHEVN